MAGTSERESRNKGTKRREDGRVETGVGGYFTEKRMSVGCSGPIGSEEDS